MSRVIPGVIMALGCLSLFLWGSADLVRCVLLLIGGVGLWEYFRMTTPYIDGILFPLTLFTALLPLFCTFFGSLEAVFFGLAGSFIGVIVLSLIKHEAISHTFSYISTTCFGALYISTGLSYLSLIHVQNNGSSWLLILLALTAGSDTGAYYIGKQFGNTKLLPSVSPKKTRAGGLGGLCVGTFAALVMSLFFSVPQKTLVLIPAAALLVILGMVGDLVESMIKRSFNIKDSGTILGGHGGMLDRIDSLLLAGPGLYYLLFFGILQ